MKTTAIIVGGGAIGLSLAWELARRDFQVTLVDRDMVGRATSWAAVGVLPPAKLSTATDPLDRLRGFSHELFPTWADQLQESTQIDTGFRRCGGWYLADSLGERAAMVGMTSYWQDLQIQCEHVDLAAMAVREPAIAAWASQSQSLSAWWAPDECQVRSPDLLSALTHACLKLGVKMVEQFDAKEIDEQAAHISILGQQDGAPSMKRFDADVMVLCAGPWTGKIAPELNLAESIVPIRGQVLMFKSAAPPLRAVVNVGNRYLVSRDDGHTLVGSCEEEVGWQLGTTDEVLDRLRQFANDVCPELNDATEVKSWSGLRPMTFDGFPMIGPLPGSQRVFVASGHYRSGVHLAPATAVTLADLIEGKSSVIDLQPFSVGKQQTKPSP